VQKTAAADAVDAADAAAAELEAQLAQLRAQMEAPTVTREEDGEPAAAEPTEAEPTAAAVATVTGAVTEDADDADSKRTLEELTTRLADLRAQLQAPTVTAGAADEDAAAQAQAQASESPELRAPRVPADLRREPEDVDDRVVDAELAARTAAIEAEAQRELRALELKAAQIRADIARRSTPMTLLLLRQRRRRRRYRPLRLSTRRPPRLRQSV
jgi:hypothetical protein